MLSALLLDFQNELETTSAIVKVSKYIEMQYFEAYGPVKDKWVRSDSARYDLFLQH